MLVVYAWWPKPESFDLRDRRQEDALCSSGRSRGLQVCGAQDGVALRRDSQTQQHQGQRDRRLHSASGEQAHHHCDGRSSEYASRSGDHQHRELWKHNRGNDSAGDGNRAPGRQIEEGKSGAAGVGWCGIYEWSYTPSMAALGKGVRLQVTGFRKGTSLQEFCLDARPRTGELVVSGRLLRWDLETID